MKNLIALLFAILLLPLVAFAQAGDYTPLPFQVKIGGQAAELKGNPSEAIHARIEKPVAADSTVEVGTKGSEMTIINVTAADDKGAPKEGASPQVLMIQSGNKTTLDKTMDGKKLTAGTYLMALVTEGKTASVLFKVQ
jgi:hypothetical protein